MFAVVKHLSLLDDQVHLQISAYSGSVIVLTVDFPLLLISPTFLYLTILRCRVSGFRCSRCLLQMIRASIKVLFVNIKSECGFREYSRLFGKCLVSTTTSIQPDGNYVNSLRGLK